MQICTIIYNLLGYEGASNGKVEEKGKKRVYGVTTTNTPYSSNFIENMPLRRKATKKEITREEVSQNIAVGNDDDNLF